MWERRYGFPAPARDAVGDRSYSREDLGRLRLIKRLIDQGHRPGKVVPLAPDALASLAHPQETRRVAAKQPGYADFIGLLHQPGTEHARDWLRRRMMREPLDRFTLGTLVPLAHAVGDAWAGGVISVHEEHLFSEILTRLLRQAIDALPRGGGPMVVLTTLPEERHGLGLLMTEALLRGEGARCVNLGVDTPIPEILLACERHGAEVLALSFSQAYLRRRILPQLQALREQLPPACQIWVGGGKIGRLRSLPGVRACSDLAESRVLLAELGVGKAAGEIG